MVGTFNLLGLEEGLTNENDDLDLNSLNDKELVEQIQDDLYDGYSKEVQRH